MENSSAGSFDLAFNVGGASQLNFSISDKIAHVGASAATDDITEDKRTQQARDGLRKNFGAKQSNQISRSNAIYKPRVRIPGFASRSCIVKQKPLQINLALRSSLVLFAISAGCWIGTLGIAWGQAEPFQSIEREDRILRDVDEGQRSTVIRRRAPEGTLLELQGSPSGRQAGSGRFAAEDPIVLIECLGSNQIWICRCGTTAREQCVETFRANNCHVDPSTGEAACGRDISDE
jgi:hypothetical protein